MTYCSPPTIRVLHVVGEPGHLPVDSSCRYLTPHCVHCSLIIQYDRPFTDAIVTYALPFLSFSIQSVVPLGLMVGLISCAHVSHLYVGLSLSSHLPLSVLRPVVHTYVTSLLIRSSFTQYPRGLLVHSLSKSGLNRSTGSRVMTVCSSDAQRA